ncbi:MAG: flippase-like domain-containing protein [Clostridia bacterium]|nr:flippase-like domain-containing protein [Clostridia bacterium]
MKNFTRPVIYKKNKLLKMYSGITQKGVSILYLYIRPKNFTKEMDENEQAVAKQKSKKSRNINLIFFLVNIGVIAGILISQISQQEDMSFSALINSTFSPAILLCALFVWFVTQINDAYRVNLLVKRSSGRSRPFLSFKTNAIGRYYDAITPMSTGGQPFQVFYLKNRGINVAAAISVPMGKYVINQICLSFVWTVCLIFALASPTGLTTVLCVVGWAINSLLMVAIIVLSVNQRVGNKIVVGVMKLLQKMKIIKNYEKSYNQVIKVVTDFQVTIKNFAKDGWTFFKLILSNMISMILSYSMAFLVYCMMIGYFDFSMWWQMFLLSVMIDMAASFIPFPGGTGVTELSFTALFAGLISPASMLTWALIFWRVLTYYILLIQGIVVMAYDNAIGNRKYLWLKKKWELEAESISFAQYKLHEYTVEKKKKSGQIF